MKVIATIALCAATVVALSSSSNASVVSSYEFGASSAALSVQPSSTDALNGAIGTIEAGGWHPAVSGNSLAALTDGNFDASGLAGLNNDFSNPALKVSYTFSAAVPIWSVTVFSGNNDERVFQTYDVEVYKSGDLDYTLLGTVQSGPFNTTYAAAGSPLAAVTSLKDSAGPLAQNVEAIRFTFYPVGNTQNFYQAPASSIVGTWVREIDVAIVPEPGSLLALGGGLVSMAALIRRRK